MLDCIFICIYRCYGWLGYEVIVNVEFRNGMEVMVMLLNDGGRDFIFFLV